MECPVCHLQNEKGSLKCKLCGESLVGVVDESAGPEGRPTVTQKRSWSDFKWEKPATGTHAAEPEVPEPEKTVHALICFPLDPVPLLEERPVTIGRAKTCDLILPVGMISREHARVVWSDGTFEIEDLKSSNGTYVNGEQVTKRALADGDTITIGPYKIAYRTHQGSFEHLRGAGEEKDATQDVSRTDLLIKSSTFSGKIGEMKLEEAFNLLDFNKKTGTLEVLSGEKKGRFHFEEGSMIAAVYHTTSGELAVARALSLKEGHFFFHSCTPDVERTLFDPTQKVLLDAMRRLDEI